MLVTPLLQCKRMGKIFEPYSTTFHEQEEPADEMRECSMSLCGECKEMRGGLHSDLM
jgi:hypothetical protein